MKDNSTNLENYPMLISRDEYDALCDREVRCHVLKDMIMSKRIIHLTDVLVILGFDEEAEKFK